MRTISTNRFKRTVFLVHFIVYIVVNIILILLNLLFSPSVIWFPYPLIGWGLGLAAHFFFALTSPKR